MDQQPQHKTQNSETFRRKGRECSTRYIQRPGLSKQDSVCPGNKANNWQIGPHKIRNFYSTKVIQTVNKRAAYRTGEKSWLARRLISRLYRELRKLNIMETKNGSEQSPQKK